jgi:hypothetical protein
MSVEQFYYTSWEDSSPGGVSGFHPRGASPGLTDEDKQALTDLASYTLPPRLDPRKPELAPVALRYSVLAPEKVALVHCQPTGMEDKGRAPNYFAHAVVLEPEALTHTPPALYWGSPFWRASAPADEGVSLPELPNFDPEPSLDLNAVWRFVGEEQRRGWLYHLLCAVIHSASANRRVVIVDTPEHVALWVAAISLLLPSRYRPLLTFATYHHNPHQASYLITGARSDVDFQLATSDFLSFFVLDTENERISQGTDSPYARFAADCARPDLYGERMLTLLGMCDRLFPPDGAINERLDDAVAYHTRVMANAGPMGPAARRALSVAIETLGAGDANAAERLEDLNEAYTLLLTALPETPEPGLVTAYEQVASMMRAADPQGAPTRLPRELWLATRLIVSGALAPGRAIAEVIQRVYGDELVGAGLNSPEYLRELTRLSANAPAPTMLSVWGFVGARVLPSPGSFPALVAMLRRAPGITPTGLTGDGAEYIEALAIATRAQAPGWLAAIAGGGGHSIPPQALRAYYYMLVKELPPERRAPYRDAMRDAQALVVYELQHDLTGASAEVNQGILERWADHAQSAPNGRAWVSTALNHLWAVAPPPDRPLIARRSLMRPTILAQLNDRSKDTLLREALKGIPLARPTPEHLAFCQQFQHNTRLTADELVLIQGVLAMDNGQLGTKTALELRERFGRLTPEMYATESREFITRFFQQDVTSEAHEAMIGATYSLANNDAFWQSYGGALLALMIDAGGARRAAQIIGYWFDSYASATGLGQFPYVVQLFFICLPALFESAQKERGYREAAREIEQYCASQPWYPLVRGMINPAESRRAKGLFSR